MPNGNVLTRLRISLAQGRLFAGGVPSQKDTKKVSHINVTIKYLCNLHCNTFLSKLAVQLHRECGIPVSAGLEHLMQPQTTDSQSLFEFTPGDKFLFGRVLFFLELKVHAPVSAGFEMVKLAKVQILDYLGPDAQTKLPVVTMSGQNRQVIVELKRIGRVIICARHPDPDPNAEPDRFLILPWPRQLTGGR